MSSRRTPRAARARTAAGLLALALALAACPRLAPEPAPGPVRRYAVRGEVTKVPAPGAPSRELGLRHEAVDDFVGQDGRITGMDAMVMMLELAPGVGVEGLSPGDKVEVALAVDWSRYAYRIEALRRLPPETPLTFGKARPPGAAR